MDIFVPRFFLCVFVSLWFKIRFRANFSDPEYGFVMGILSCLSGYPFDLVKNWRCFSLTGRFSFSRTFSISSHTLRFSLMDWLRKR